MKLKFWLQSKLNNKQIWNDECWCYCNNYNILYKEYLRIFKLDYLTVRIVLRLSRQPMIVYSDTECK